MSSSIEDACRNPRSLTPMELWAGWNVQDYANINDYTVPKEYPSIRLTYDLLSPAATFNLQDLGSQKVVIYQLIQRMNVANVSELTEQWSTRMEEPFAEDELEGRISLSEKGKDEGNRLYKEGAFEEALLQYAEAWIRPLPYHVDALAPSDPLRKRLGMLDATLFSNMSAAWISASKHGHGLNESRRRHCHEVAYNCAWASLEAREYAPVSVVKNASQRLLSILVDKYAQHQPQSEVEAMAQWLRAQVAALENLPKGMLFSDISPESKVPPPIREILQTFGPRGWRLEKERLLSEIPRDLWPNWVTG